DYYCQSYDSSLNTYIF
nr:immunoglobulin light chain junction region [Macaca mulatta]MOV96201.1 immunoglobulin light chain junction region [Macaca mulatta]MOV99494.1 immunoglobulin light chain junction region [Macaca mulatta]MOW00851.1 immunoglobulin light chain junction region [Macaca mulatta]MOW01709.1 immunoglobulin light chain junction region [Macaca mulatta]